MLQKVALLELFFCWILWSLGFVPAFRRSAGYKKAVRAPVSRWGMILQALGYTLAWIPVRPAEFHKSALSLIASLVISPIPVALGWAATRHLGKQWRYEAALIDGHELIQSGPYRFVRHPIYASMLGLLLASGAAWTWWPMFLAALVVFIIGIEIRVRAEDRLLAGRFQTAFAAYRSRVPAYIPLIH